MYVVCLVGPPPVVAVSYVGSCKSPVNLLFYTLTLLFFLKLGRGNREILPFLDFSLAFRLLGLNSSAFM